MPNRVGFGHGRRGNPGREVRRKLALQGFAVAEFGGNIACHRPWINVIDAVNQCIQGGVGDLGWRHLGRWEIAAHIGVDRARHHRNHARALGGEFGPHALRHAKAGRFRRAQRSH